MWSEEFKDKVVLITGSAAGIGATIAEEFAKAGARVVVNSRQLERLQNITEKIRNLGAEVLPIETNVRDYDQVTAMMEKIVDHFGQLDVLINNAAGTFRIKAEELSPNGWRAIIDTNLNGTFFCCRAAFPYLKKSGGNIINISSIAGCVPSPSRVHYGAAKAAINHLTQSLAVEWAPHNIRVNAVAPGPIYTQASSWTDEEAVKKRIQLVPMGRIGTPEEVASICLFLASSKASYITGEVVRVDGGPLGLW